MNNNRKPFLFVTGSTGILLLVSLFCYIADVNWLPLKRVNLVSDIVTVSKDSIHIDSTESIAIPVLGVKKEIDFTLYQRPRFITDFNADTLQPSLNGFLQKLYDLKTGKKRKVRIAYFGDSMIEGDLLTQTLRKALQNTFGGSGVGFVPVTSQVSQFRQTVLATYSPGWEDANFRGGKTSNLYLSGHLFKTTDAWVQMTDQTVKKDSVILEKSLLCGYSSGTVNVTVNNRSFSVRSQKPCSRIILEKNRSANIKLSVADDQLPVYGLTFESESGVIVDNFSFRGISGIELAILDSAFLSSINESNPYDLVVLQYGVNLLFRPNDKNFKWYARAMMPIIKKIKSCFPSCEFLIVSTADRAFSYNNEYKSAVGIDSLIKVQALLAYETGSCFYNLFQTMGGRNSIVQWARQKPALANKDYVHPNFRGAEILGNYFYEAIMNDYNKYAGAKK